MRDYSVNPLKYKETVSREDLYELYITQNKTISELEQLFNRSENWISKQLKEYGIKKDYKAALIRRNQTCLAKYGKLNPMQDKQVQEKAKQTCLKIYGVEHAAQSEEIKKKSAKVNLNKFGYISRTCDPNVQEIIKEKVRKTCEERYGRYNVTQIQLEDSTFEILTDRQKLIEFINSEENKTPIYLANKLKMSSDRLVKRCREYGIENLLNLSGNSSYYETEIKELFPDIKLQKNRKVISPLEIDLYNEDLKIGIEFNGDYWHSKIEDKYYHQKKSLIARNKGIFIYHIFEHEWLNPKLKVKIINQLNNLFNKNQFRIYARNCKIQIPTKEDKNKFLEQNHIQGRDNSVICYGLYYNNELVTLMTFCRPRFNRRCEWELSRFCTKAGYNVVGGASKLFKRFTEDYSGDIVSYSDLTKTRGNVYEKLGFSFEEVNKPQYHWIRGSTVLSRYQTRISDEINLMQSKDFVRVYDCGTIRWIFKRR